MWKDIINIRLVLNNDNYGTQYLSTFVVETDHKSLEMNSMKNLITAPVRLQRMLL